jgi:PIN domain nuclease of toxin-antitoxin system
LRLLLDTHALIWWLRSVPILSATARAEISDPDAEVFVSAATAWEIAIKQALGRLDPEANLEERLGANHFRHLPITVAHGLAAGALPRHHNDPFDRMLIAQAAAEQLTIVTRDARFTPYGVPTLPA